MISSYVKIILRVLFKNRLFSIVSTISLSIGLAFFILIMGYILHEFSFEKCHVNADDIVRMEGSFANESNRIIKYANLNKPLGESALRQFPEIEKAAIFKYQNNTHFTINETDFEGSSLLFATPEFLDVFTFPLAYGDYQKALSTPYRVLIKEDAVKKYFPNQNPVGDWILLNDSLNCRIVGILEKAPTNTQLKFDFLVSYSTLEVNSVPDISLTDFGEDYVYFKLKPGTDIVDLSSRLNTMFTSGLPSEEKGNYSLWLKPLKKIYFSAYYDGNQGEFFPAGEWDMIIILGAFAFFILIQAVINYISLATARTAQRIKEVSIRKTFGAARLQIILQFFGESFFMVLGAMALSLLLYEPFRPILHQAFDYRSMTANLWSNSPMPIALIVLLISVSFLSGLYPALYMSRYHPLSLMRQAWRIKTTRSWFRRILVLVQFMLALFFIASTLVVFRQMNYITKLDKGFRIENMMTIRFDGEGGNEKAQILKNELQNKINASNMSVSSAPPGINYSLYSAVYHTEERKEDEAMYFRTYIIDENFLNTFDLSLKQGRDLFELDDADRQHAILVSQGLVDNLQLENPIGHRFYGHDDKFYIISGVIDNFYSSFESHNSTSSVILSATGKYLNSLTIQCPEGQIPETIETVREAWKNIFPETTFKYEFLDEASAESLKMEYATGYMMAAIAFISLLIAGLGIFGLVTYTAEQRTKEIGIRKVLGASSRNMVWLVSKEFTVLILIANVITLPLALLFMKSFLQTFIFQVPIGPGTMVLPALITITLAIFSAGFQAFKAARMHPVDSLRHE